MRAISLKPIHQYCRILVYFLLIIGLASLLFLPFGGWVLTLCIPLRFLAIPVLSIACIHASSEVWRRHLLEMLPPRTLPCLSPQEQSALDIPGYAILIPTLLADRKAIDGFIKTLDTNFRAVNDRRARFVVLADGQDSQQQALSDEEQGLLRHLQSHIEGLNTHYGRGGVSPFVLMSRERRYAVSEGVWMGWERKMGKILAFFELVCTGESELNIQSGQRPNTLHNIPYAIVLDEDNLLTPGAAQAMLATIAHPYNQPKLDIGRNRIQSGYGIIRPATDQRSVKLPSRQTIFDVFGEIRFPGKGIYNIPVAYELLESQYVEGRILSHDMWESLVVRTGYTALATVVEDMPSNHIAGYQRAHRWTRGDWQNFLLMLTLTLKGKRFPAFGWLVILSDIRNSVFPLVFTVGLVLIPLYGSVGLLCLYIGSVFLYEIIRALRNYVKIYNSSDNKFLWLMKITTILVLALFFEVMNSPHKMLSCADAISRTIFNFVRNRNMLVWRSFSQTEASGSTQGFNFLYMWLVAVLAALMLILCVALQVFRPALLALLVLWTISPVILLSIRRKK